LLPKDPKTRRRQKRGPEKAAEGAHQPMADQSCEQQRVQWFVLLLLNLTSLKEPVLCGHSCHCPRETSLREPRNSCPSIDAKSQASRRC
jgi:hypothetical protein